MYKRITYRDKNNPEWVGVHDTTNGKVSTNSQAIQRLAILEDKIEKGLLIEIGYCKKCNNCEKTSTGLFCNLHDTGTEANDKCRYFEKKT